MHAIKITPNLLFKYQCTSGKFITLPNRIEKICFGSENQIETIFARIGMLYHSLSLASVKSRSVLLFWYRLTRVVPEKGLLNGCVCVLLCYLQLVVRWTRHLHLIGGLYLMLILLPQCCHTKVKTTQLLESRFICCKLGLVLIQIFKID